MTYESSSLVCRTFERIIAIRYKVNTSVGDKRRDIVAEMIEEMIRVTTGDVEANDDVSYNPSKENELKKIVFEQGIKSCYTFDELVCAIMLKDDLRC